MKNKLPRVLYGGDYNPDQWPANTWAKDIQVFKQAEINSATINVFSWAALEPSEGVYDFHQLDAIIKELSDNDFSIVLATSTAVMPAWMFKNYPDVARVDYQGRRHNFGQRHNFCPSSLNYQHLANDLVDHLAKRYAGNQHIVAWHVNNEYGGNCYCDNCVKAFRLWLKKRYQTLDNLNKAWDNAVWSHTIHQWDEIVAPNELGDAWGPECSHTIVAGLSIDYLRFQSESLHHLYSNEKNIIEQYDQHTPVMTNVHSAPNKMIDYQEWAKDQNIIAYDSYPFYDEPWYKPAFLYDLMRGLKQGQPFMLMESTPSQVNWQPYSPMKRPGQMRATEFQAVAHGADTVQFFQLKKATGGSEKFHGAVIAHSQRTDTRAFREVAQLGHDLKKVGNDFIGSRVSAKVALVFDWANFWSYEYVAGISQDFNYVDDILDYYKQLYRLHVPVDVISVDDDFSKYDLVVAPVLYMVKTGLEQKIEDYVKHGGHFVTTYMSGLVDEQDNVYLGGYPGALKKLTGIWVEESDAVTPKKTVKVSLDGGLTCDATLVCDQIHLEGAKELGHYASEFYAGTPAVTINQFGKGQAWYVGTRLDDQGLGKVMADIIHQLGIQQLTTSQTPLEITRRQKDGKDLTFILNLSNQEETLTADFQNEHDLLTGQPAANTVAPWGVMILTK